MQKEKKEGGGQAVPLTGNLPKPPKLPFFSGLRHLIVKTSRMCHVTRQLAHFRALRTLSLEAVNANQPLRMALDVTALTELKHLAIHNFCMDSIAAPQGCKLDRRQQLWLGTAARSRWVALQQHVAAHEGPIGVILAAIGIWRQALGCWVGRS